ncbi:MAG: hypothetical protein ABIK96_12710 [bacterium]
MRHPRRAGIRCCGGPERFLSTGPAGSLLIILAALTVASSGQGPFVPAAAAQEDSGTVFVKAPDDPVEAAERDSLLLEIRHYTRMIAAMRDSLVLDDLGIELTEERKQQIKKSIEEVGKAVEDISQELSQLDLEIIDNRISLLNKSGEGIVINIPENLDQNISEGLNAITKLILSELPDSLRFEKPDSWTTQTGKSKSWHWNSLVPRPPRTPRKVIPGNVVKVGDDLLVREDEDIRGNVIVVMGSLELSGRVQGDVVVVMGDVLVSESAEVKGQIVTVLGRLDQDPDADVGEVVVVDPFGSSNFSFKGLFGAGWISFLVSQGLFFLTLVLAALGAVIVPRARFERVVLGLRTGAAQSLGIGFILALVGHAVLLALMAILVLTVIGLPLALLLGLAVALASILAVAVAAAVVGEKVCAALGRTCASPLLAVVVGMIILHAFSFAASLVGISPALGAVVWPLSILGILVKTLAYLLGLGAIVRTRLGSS